VRLRRLERLLKARRSLSRLLMSERDPARLMERTCSTLCQVMGWPGAWGVCCDESGELRHRSWAGQGLNPDHIRAHSLDATPLPCVRAALDRPGIHFLGPSDTTCSGCRVLTPPRRNGVVLVQLEHAGEVLGALVLQTPTMQRPSGELQELIEDLCTELALALHTHRIETARREEGRRFRTVTDTAKDAVIMMAEDGTVSLWNPAAETIFGYSADEAMGKTIHAFLAPERYHAAHLAAFPAFQRTGRGGAVGRTLELAAVHKRGHEIPIELSLSAFQREGRWHAVAIARDITDRKRLQAQLAQADRLASVGMLAAGVAHEINNPLAYILYNLESLDEDLAPSIDPELLADMRERLHDAREGADRIRVIARDLKTFSRVESTQREALCVTQPMDAAANMAHNEIKHRARLERDYAQVPPVLGNEGGLAQVFLNLLINAAQAIPEGAASQHRIGLAVRQRGDWILATVSDSGSGIDPEHMERLFDPFHTTKAKGTGSGLGLAICQRIVSEHGGEIQVESTPGRGSRFTVRLPVLGADLDPEQATVELERELGAPAAGRFLVVDDEPLIGRSITRVLDREHEVVYADSGLAACRILERDTIFDAVICDLMMPVMTGMELHAWMEQHVPHLAGRMIFMTGGAFTPRGREFLEEYQGPRLDKPISARRLRAVVQGMLVD